MNIRPKKHVFEVFNKGFFWDADPVKISFARDKYLVIERVLNRSFNLDEDLPKLENIYPKDLIIHIALNSREIFGNEQIEKIASHYKLNPSDFKKYVLDLKHRNVQ